MPSRPWACCSSGPHHLRLDALRDCEDTSAPELVELQRGTAPAALVTARVALAQLEAITRGGRSLEEVLTELLAPRAGWRSALRRMLGPRQFSTSLRSCRVQGDPDLLLLDTGRHTLGLRRVGAVWEAAGVDPRAGLWLSPAWVDPEHTAALEAAGAERRHELALLGLRYEARTHLLEACAVQGAIEAPSARTRPAWWAVIAHAEWASSYALRAAACTLRGDEFQLAWEVIENLGPPDGPPVELLPQGLLALTARACR